MREGERGVRGKKGVAGRKQWGERTEFVIIFTNFTLAKLGAARNSL